MSRYQMITFDMDGTLLDSKKQIAPDSIAAIEKAVNAGRVVALSTGRCPAELEPYRQQLKNVRYVIGNSGALVWDFRSGEHLFERSLTRAESERILKAAEPFDVMIQYLSYESIVEGRCVERMADYRMAVYEPLYRQVATKVDDIRAYLREHEFPVCKLNLYFTSPEDRSILENRIADMPLTLAYSEATTLECSPKGISKAEGLRALCAATGISIENTISVGDSYNDLEILSAAGLSVAMGNANETVKAVAKVTVADNDHGGCAEIIEKYLLAD